MMKRIFKKLFKKNYLLTQLMQTYSLLLATIILLTVAALCVYVTHSSQNTLDSQKNSVLYQLDTYVSNKNDAITNMVDELAGSPTKMENMRNYMSLRPDQYFDYISNIWSEYRADINFASSLRTLFSTYPDLEAVYLNLEEFDTYLKADRINLNGKKLPKPFPEVKGFHLMRVISDQYTGQTLGELYAVFSEDAALGNQRAALAENGLNAFIYDNAGSRIFTANHQVTTEEVRTLDERLQHDQSIQFLDKRYEVQQIEASSRTPIIILASRQIFWRKVLWYYAIILTIGLLLIGILLVILNRTFKRYTKQVDLIVEATQVVGDGNLKERIDTELVQAELHDIATAINFMISSLDRYIEDIYTLEIKQRDAHMRALQSQINPHFLYNTLEYIRMYALSRQQDELADVVYAFSALLRNNIDQSKTTTLEKEISFCEKYVFLYQMRYPDQFAYKLDVAPAISKTEIPKFIIQPLIENYFVHGIDYSRQDNAISVKAYQENGQIVIQVTDNGKGMSPDRLAEVQAKLEAPDVEMVQSIGLRNVHERLKSFYGDSYQMLITSTLGAGTQITLRFDPKEGFDV